MNKIQNLNQLFSYQLQDLYSAQKQFANALGEVRGSFQDDALGNEVESLWNRTRQQVDEMERVAGTLDIDPSGNKCEAAEGLIREMHGFLSENTDSDVRDAGLIANLQRILHYQIAGFGTAATYAKQLGLDDVAVSLNEMLEYSRGCDERFTELAEERITRQAVSG